MRGDGLGGEAERGLGVRQEVGHILVYILTSFQSSCFIFFTRPVSSFPAFVSPILFWSLWPFLSRGFSCSCTAVLSSSPCNLSRLPRFHSPSSSPPSSTLHVGSRGRRTCCSSPPAIASCPSTPLASQNASANWSADRRPRPEESRRSGMDLELSEARVVSSGGGGGERRAGMLGCGGTGPDKVCFCSKAQLDLFFYTYI